MSSVSVVSLKDNHALECTVGLKMAAIHCYSVTNFIHFTQQRRVYYSQKQIGFRSSMTGTFKRMKNLKSEMCVTISAYGYATLEFTLECL